MANDFKPITTQEQLDEVIGERLNRQKGQFEEKLKGYEKLIEDYDNLQKEVEAKNLLIEENKNNVATKEEEFEKLNKELEELKINQLKQSIAIKNGLPFELSSRLKGTDEESILEDAKALLDVIGSNNTRVAPMKDTEPNDVSDEDSEYLKMLENLEL